MLNFAFYSPAFQRCRNGSFFTVVDTKSAKVESIDKDNKLCIRQIQHTDMITIIVTYKYANSTLFLKTALGRLVRLLIDKFLH